MVKPRMYWYNFFGKVSIPGTGTRRHIIRVQTYPVRIEGQKLQFLIRLHMGIDWVW